MPRVNLNQSSSIVSGGASGIGEATARQLAEAGSKVVIADLNEERGQQVADEVGGLFVKCDVTKTEDADTVVAAASELSPLRACVNSAGLGLPARTIDRNNEPMDIKGFDFVIQVNLVGTFNVLSRAASAMAKTEPMDADGARGAIVNMASCAAFDGQIGQASYSASKGGVVGMTLPIARDLSAAGIRVNTVAPGLIDTPIYGEGEQAEARKAHLGASVFFPEAFRVCRRAAFYSDGVHHESVLECRSLRMDGGIRMPPK